MIRRYRGLITAGKVDYSSVCAGGSSCSLAPENYVVINHDLNQRWSFDIAGAEPDPETSIQPPVVNGFEISWSDSGWYQIQSTSDYSTVCEGGDRCLVEAGAYNVINHSANQRWDNVVVAGSNPEPPAVAELLSSLDYTVVDAEFSQTLDRIIIIMVTANPNQLVIYNGHTHESHAINLPLTATSVSVDPDGTFAAVGHNASISYINLITSQLLKTIPVSTSVSDIVLGGNGYVYAFPAPNGDREIVSVNLSTEEERPSLYTGIYPGGQAKIHPNGQKMYGIDGSGVSPSDIYQIPIANGNVSDVIDSPYHGDFDMCGNLWLSQSGNQVFTACGNTFRTSGDDDNDMRYIGSFSHLEGINYLHHSQKTSRLAVIPDASHYSASDSAATDTEFQLYSEFYREHLKTRKLPEMTVGDRSYASHGKFIFLARTAPKYT